MAQRQRIKRAVIDENVFQKSDEFVKFWNQYHSGEGQGVLSHDKGEGVLENEKD